MRGFLREYLRFAIEHKWYWLAPLLLMLGLIALVIYHWSGSAVVPVSYQLF